MVGSAEGHQVISAIAAPLPVLLGARGAGLLLCFVVPSNLCLVPIGPDAALQGTLVLMNNSFGAAIRGFILFYTSKTRPPGGSPIVPFYEGLLLHWLGSQFPRLPRLPPFPSPWFPPAPPTKPASTPPGQRAHSPTCITAQPAPTAAFPKVPSCIDPVQVFLASCTSRPTRYHGARPKNDCGNL